MIISRAEIASAVSGYKPVKRKSAPGGGQPVDSYERSDATDSLMSLFASAAEPFYRPNLVESLRRQISEGRYYVPSEAIVEKMLGRLIVEAAVAA
jgi:anti-sigma28 factor (negative regulator of flagellin synthesis)